MEDTGLHWEMEANIDGTGVAIIFCVTELLTGSWLGSRSLVCLSLHCAVSLLSVSTRLDTVPLLAAEGGLAGPGLTSLLVTHHSDHRPGQCSSV